MSDAQLVAGVATLLDAADIAVWNPGGTYAADQVGIYSRRLPPAPDGGLALTTYPVSDDPTLSDSITGLQVLGRTGGQDPTTTDDLMDAVFNQLQGLFEVTLSTGIQVVSCARQSGLPLPQDDLKRWARSDNYYVTIWRPSPNRT